MVKLSRKIIKYPDGVWFSKSTPPPVKYCALLNNFIPTKQGLQLRKGNKVIDWVNNYTYIAPWSSDGSIIGFTNNGITRYDINTKALDIIISDVSPTPINYIETNARLIFFFTDAIPQELFYDTVTNDYILQDLVLSGADFLDFTGAVRYREHLWYYKEGSNQLYYTDALAYMGELFSYNIAQIFNSKGKLKTLAIAGYSSGGGVQSNLIAVKDSGDMLVFDGLNPEDVTQWKVVTQISLGTQVTNQTVQFGTSLLLLTARGLVDISNVIVMNTLDYATGLGEPLNDLNLDYSQLKLDLFSTFILIHNPNRANNYIYNTDTQGYATLTGLNVFSGASLFDEYYFVDLEGNLFKAFDTVKDELVVNKSLGLFDYKPITGFYETAWDDFNQSNNKKVNFLTVDLFSEGGDYNISAQVATNYNITTFNNSRLPKQINTQIRWDDITDWRSASAKLWTGKVLNAYNTIKFPRSGLGRTMATKITVIGYEVTEFVVGNITIDYEMAGF